LAIANNLNELISSPLWQNHVHGNQGIKIFFTTTAVVLIGGRRIERKILNARVVFFHEPHSTSEIVEKNRGVSEAELSEIKRSVVSGQKMTEEDWNEMSASVCVKEYRIAAQSLLKPNVIGRNQIRISAEELGSIRAA